MDVQGLGAQFLEAGAVSFLSCSLRALLLWLVRAVGLTMGVLQANNMHIPLSRVASQGIPKDERDTRTGMRLCHKILPDKRMSKAGASIYHYT